MLDNHAAVLIFHEQKGGRPCHLQQYSAAAITYLDEFMAHEALAICHLIWMSHKSTSCLLVITDHHFYTVAQSSSPRACPNFSFTGRARFRFIDHTHVIVVVSLYETSLNFWERTRVGPKALNDKLQGSVAAYLRCGGVVNNQIKKGLMLSMGMKNFLKSVNIWQSYEQERDCLVHFGNLVNTLLQHEE